MIIDCVLYAGEKECLDIRFNELVGVVDHFIVQQAAETFTGKPREVVWPPHPNCASFFTIYPLAKFDDPWQRETHQRNALLGCLKEWGAKDDDIILLGDVDEIPSAEAVKVAAELAATGQQIAFDQTLCTYYVNVQCVNMRWRGTQAVRYDRLKAATPQGVRDFRNHAPFVANGGWHFSSVMSPEKIREKLQSFSHTECNRPEYTDLDHIRKCMAECRDVTGRTDVRFAIEFHAKLPQYIVDNAERFAHMFYPGTVDNWIKRPSMLHGPQYAGRSTG